MVWRVYTLIARKCVILSKHARDYFAEKLQPRTEQLINQTSEEYERDNSTIEADTAPESVGEVVSACGEAPCLLL